MMDPIDAERSLPAGVRELDHTADAGLEVEAETLPELFDRAARGLIALGVPTAGAAQETHPAPVRRALALEASDLAGLLVRWLSEVLYRADAEGMAYRRSRPVIAPTGTRLEAAVEEEALPGPGADLKSVTYHGLSCERAPGGGWRARVIFDV